jgi:FkbM family methyltransferase
MYKIKKIISKLLGFFGYEIQRHSSASLSVKEPFYHFRNLLDNSQPLIFDVGAYVGDTIEQFKLSFPGSYIHAFEPFDESFSFLKNRFQKTDKIFFNNMALGDCSLANNKMYITQNKGSSSLLQPAKGANEFWEGNPLSTQEEVKVETTTIDSYCQQYNIKSIDILKIDVQGNELKVLQGAKRMLKETRVKVIFTEISIAPNYEAQSEIDEVIKLLRENEYKIFNFFKMKHKEGKLIECDVLFYAEKLFF